MRAFDLKVTSNLPPAASLHSAAPMHRSALRSKLGTLKRAAIKNISIALTATLLSTATWAACSGVTLDVGYDFDLGGRTGIAPADVGACVAGATTAPAGDDYCAGNTTNVATGDYVIRTNDSGNATLKYTFNAGTKRDDYIIVVDIPRTGDVGATSTRPAGLTMATWTGLPSACSGPTSAITNGGTRLTCDLGTIDRSASGQTTVAVSAPYKASGRALNGETFKIVATQQASGGSTGGLPGTPSACTVGPADTVAPTLTISARPKIDIKTSAYTYSPVTRYGTTGYDVSYFVYVDGLNNATVGGEAVASPLSFNVGLSANIPTPGVRFIQIADYYGNTTDIVPTTAVIGDPAGNGILIPVTIKPNPGAPNCAVEFLIPGGACQEVPLAVPQRLSTHYITYFVPITAFGSASQIDFNNFINSDGAATGTAISTPPASGSGSFAEPVSENNAPYTIVKVLPGSYAKYTSQFAETRTERPPGSPAGNPQSLNELGGFNWCVGGDCKQYPTKNVESLLILVNRSSTEWNSGNGFNGVGAIVCDKFDNRGMVLTRKPRSAGSAAYEFPTNDSGDPVGATRIYQQPGTIPSGYTLEVATAAGTPAGGAYPPNSQNCGDADAAWVSTSGITDFSAYNLVRMKVPVVKTPFDAGSDGAISMVFFFTVPLSAPNGAYIGNQLKLQSPEDFGGAGAGPGSWSAGVFNPITNSGVYNGERFQVVKALVRTGKEAYDRFGNTTTIIGAGKTVTFQLTPSYTAAPGVPSPNSNIEVVDVLPVPLTYVVGSARSGTPSVSLEPNSITIDGSGRQVLTWVLPNIVLNAPIAPIYFDARAPEVLASGTVLTNKVTVAAPLVDQSTDAERSAVKAVTVDNVAGLFVNKSISTPLIPRNGTYSFTLEVGNLKSTVENNIDIIDVLPRSGSVISAPQSNFAGTNVLSGPVTPPAGGTVYYTNAVVGAAPTALHTTVPAGPNALPIAADYAIAANAANGWCTAAEVTASTAGCPASFAGATAIRVQVPTIGGNALLQVVVSMTTNGNAENNIYVNRFSAQGATLPPLFSNDVLTVVKQGKISGKVYVDTNLNSQPTAGEPSIPGVTITLTGTDSNGNPVTKTTATDSSGNYEFADLFPGTYALIETQPPAYGSAGTNVPGSAGGSSTQDNFAGIQLVVGQNGTNYNFGEIGSTIAGKVCEDLNNDGKCQAGEPPIAGVVITLSGTDSGGNSVNRTATTTATGDWKISDLPNPNATGFTLTETQPTGYLDGKQSPGVLTPVAGGTDSGANIGTTTAAIVGNDAITGIKFTQGTDGTNYDFAEVKPASLQGFVYYDTNTNGTRAPTEPGIAGVILELTGTNDMGQPVALTTTTSITPDGSYTFSNLRPGTYTVREIQPVAPAYSLVDGTVTVGSVAYTTQPVAPAASNGALTTETPSTVSGSGEGVSGIVLGSGGNGTNYNFGEVPLVPISGTVFVDKNFGGTLDAGTETGLPNSGITTLTLCRTANEPCPPADTVATTTSTPGSGTYTFPPQPSGSYFVVEAQPAGYGSSSLNVQPVTLVTTPVTNVNFAETGALISGTVYADNNADGALQVGTDLGIPGATVKLCLTSSLPACASPVATTTTSSTGTYAFADIPAPPAGQTYTILEDEGSAPLTSYTNGTSTVGALDSVAGNTGFVNGTAPTAEQGPTFTANSTIRDISFIMPVSLIQGTPPVVGTNYNFGELPVAGISGRVFVDRDFTNGATGAYNPSTDGALLNNAVATVTLCSVDPAATAGVCPIASVVATTTTAADGTYGFPVVPAGNFWVVESQPAGYGSSSPNVVPVIRTGADPVINVNFAETLAVLSGRVYRDDDASGTDTAGETGIGGVTVKLCLSTDLACATPVATTITTPTSGTYTFANLLAPATGVSYFIKEEQSTVPATLQNGTTTVGSLVVGSASGAPVGTANSTNNTISNITWTPSTTVVNAPQAVGTVYNFGELPISNISGRVFVDRDFTNGTTGTYNPATDGTLVNNGTTTITLCSVDPAATGGVCPPASVVGTTTTATDGSYNFSNVPPGNYWVIETQPQGYGSSSPNVVPVNRTGTTPVSKVDFADTLAEIKGTVYKDDNANGVLNPADPGIGGVTVKLCLSSDAACATPVQTTTTTPTSGTYTFANLPAPPAGQTYFIKEEQSTVPAGLLNGTTTVGQLTVGAGATAPVGAANSPASTINAITWTPDSALVNAPAAVGTDYNFGEVPTTTVSGAVILDKDFTGTSTPGDTGLPVTTTVTLCRSAPATGQACPPADVVATTTTTPGSGTYTFPAVTPGTYYVVETQPVGYASSSPNTSAPVVVATVPVTGVNFYETGATLSGFVYKDTNFNGVKDATGDIPLPNVTVRLCTTNNCAAGSVVATTATSVAGAYQFNDLPAPALGQQYFIVEDQATVPATPTVLSDGTTTVGTFTLTGTGGSSVAGTPVQTPSRVDGISWVPPTSVQTGVAAVVGANFNFGEIDGFDISGQVFFDKNRDGVLNPATDTPLATVTLTLCSVATVPCPPTNIVGTTTTDITGNYTFPKVPPGSYFVQETQPVGYGSSPSSPNVRPVTVAGAPITGINFADTLSSIAGLVYRDDNGSQTRDGVESTMPAGITITLTGVDASGARVNLTTVTSATGTYAFDNLRTGTYTITESQPANFGTGGSNPGTLAGGTGAPNSNVISNVVLPVNTDAPNYNFGDTPQTAGVSGSVWRDNDHDNQRDAGEPPLVGWTVQVLRTPPGGGTPTVVTSVQTGSNGDYSVTGLEAGGGYSIRFIAPGGAVFGGAVDGEQGTPVSGATIVRGEISSLTLTASVTGGPNTVPQQSLPVDPSGVVYDSDTRLPVPGAVVTFVPVACPAFNPATDLVGGSANLAQTVGADGIYQFLLNPSAPTCQYRLVVTPPATYALDPAIPPQPGAYTPGNRPPNTVDQIVPNATAPTAGQPTTYFLTFNLNNNSRDVVNNHIPLVAGNRPVLFITKVAGRAKVELGDTVKYTVRVRYAGGAVNLPVLKVVDTMPAGFKLIAETSYVSVPLGAPAVLLPASRIAGAPGAVVTYDIPLPAGGFVPGSEIELTYRVRVAVGSMQGDGINRAQARSIGTIRSNTAQAKVIVDPGVFTNDGCVAGKVFVDCNNNHIQDAEEIGVPGVRMYMEDGTYFITDSEGKYSYCGISPKSHVISVDMLTMPRGSRMTTTSNRNLGDGNSIFLDTKNGQLIRADFAEGSCSNTVLEQVKRRRTQGEVRSTETEKTGQPALKFEGKSPQYPQQGTDSANQPLVVPRSTNGGTTSVPEQNTPVPQMPGASSNTQGANVRNAK